MSTDQYILGIDYGTLSGRAAIVRVTDGHEAGSAISEFKHQVMDRTLTAGDNQKLPPEFALQNPQDYIDVLTDAVPRAVQESGVDPEQIIGIGIDFTSATVIPTDAEGNPLCEQEEFKNRPHAYVKLWKHHAGQDEADKLLAVAQARGEDWLPRYGGLMSSELLLPKVLETFKKDREVYDATERFVEALDWIVWKMTGNLVYAAGDSGYKRHYQDEKYPTKEYLEAVQGGFGTVYEDKMPGEVRPLGSSAGKLTDECAELMGLKAGIDVAVGNIDAHVSAAAAQAVEPGQLCAILGTSAVYIVNGPDLKEVPGMFGVVDGGVVDGLWAFEAGQSGVGDVFAWVVDNCTPGEYVEEAEKKGISVHELLTTKAAEQEVGEHGLVCLDWLNGNRSILVDNNLSGLILGITLTTQPEDLYRALMESTAFGARRIIQSFQEAGVEINEIVACGGLLKNKWLMQMYSDVTNLPLSVATTTQVGALGSAVYGAVAAGVYEDLKTASAAMGGKEASAYTPDPERAKQYDELYKVYVELHDHFGRGANKIMHRLKKIRAQAHERGTAK